MVKLIKSIVIAGFIMTKGTLPEHCSDHMFVAGFFALAPFLPQPKLYTNCIYLFVLSEIPRKHSSTIHMNHIYSIYIYTYIHTYIHIYIYKCTFSQTFHCASTTFHGVKATARSAAVHHGLGA